MQHSRWLPLCVSVTLLLLVWASPTVSQDGSGKYAREAPSPAEGWPVPPGHYGLLATYADRFLSNAPAFYGISWAALTDATDTDAPDQLDDFFVLDVRATAAFNSKHLAGAVNIPYSEVVPNLDLLPLDKPILVVCGSGFISAQVGTVLGILGYEVRMLTGGIGSVPCGGPVICSP